jgi:hypothetical protein
MFSLQDFQSLFMAGRATAGECQQTIGSFMNSQLVNPRHPA